jgi:alpha-tubulin suppressor-like RCC1 family protein
MKIVTQPVAGASRPSAISSWVQLLHSRASSHHRPKWLRGGTPQPQRLFFALALALPALAHAGLPQSIPPAGIAIKSPTAAPFSLPATSSAGLPISWSKLVGPVTVTGSTVTPTGASGAVTLLGSQAGNATYDAAPARYVTFIVEAGGGFIKVAAGEAHVVAIRSDGSLWSWGKNSSGQLGDGSTTDRFTPTQISAAGTTWTDVACGSAHSVARKSDGTVWTWGDNSQTQLGIGPSSDRLFPIQVGSVNTWTGVACGSFHTLARRSNGSLWTWGDNAQGQLGDNSLSDRSGPVQVGTALDWTEISGGSQHSIGRRAGGSIWTWGANAFGQIGDGTSVTRRLIPTRVGLASDWANVSAGFLFNLARKTNGTLYAWGNNDSGQLGNDTRTGSNVPVQVGTDTDWISLRCGAAFATAVKSNDMMWAWGDNSAGQLGDGSTADRLTPVSILAGPWSSIAAGSACVLAVQNEVLWTWGTNDNDQLALPPTITGISAVPPAPRVPLPRPQTIADAPTIPVGVTTTVPTSSSSALPTTVRVLSGPATSHGSGVSFTAGGTVQIEVVQAGDASWEPAPTRTFTLNVDATGPVFTVAPANQFVQQATPAGTMVSFTATAVDAVSGPAAVTCVPASGSVFPGGITTVVCTTADAFSNVSTHTFTVTVNRKPVAASMTVSSLPPMPSFTLSATDADMDATTLSVITPPAHGTLTGSLPNFTFVPETGFVGTTSLMYKANDGSIDSAPATVTIEVLNHVPVADPSSHSLSEFTTKAITLSGSDGNGQALTYRITTPPTRGMLSGTLPAATYTPTSGQGGADSFQYVVNDGIADSAPATVTVLVNDAPTAPNRSLSTNEDTPLPLTLTGTDTNGNPLSDAIISQPMNGTLEASGANWTYRPSLNYHGPDSFTYQVNDGFVSSATATVSLTVTAVNDTPVAAAQSVTTAEDTALPITLTGTDVEGSTLTFAITVPPQHGTLSGTGSSRSYTPALNYNGPDSFSFTVNDGQLTSTAAVIAITVQPVNDAPVANPVAVTSVPNVAFTLSGIDIESSPLTFSIVTPPASGTLTGTSPQLVFTPAAAFTGPISFTYKANDGELDSAPATITLTVLNVAPVVAPVTHTLDEDVPTAITLTGTDANLHPLTFTVIVPPSHGTLNWSHGANWTYSPSENYHGSDAFTYRANDGIVNSNVATVSLAITSVNDAPETAFEVFSLNEDEVLTTPFAKRVLRNDSDLHDGALGENNNPLTAQLATGPSHAASFSLNPNGTFVYTPRANFHGLDLFTYRTVDALGAASAPETVLIGVAAVNDAPVALPQTITTLEDVPASIHLRSADADVASVFDPNAWIGLTPPNYGPAPHDADPTYVITMNPQHGTLTGTLPHVIYTPAANHNGTDSFAFTANDGLATSAPAIVSITIQADLDADALPDVWELSAFSSLAYTATDDPDGDGQNNAFEFIAGNNPADANSCLCLELAAPGTFRLNRVQPGVRYHLQTSPDLLAWDTVITATYTLMGPGAVVDPRTDDPPRRYTRVTVSLE